jgi:hypothetical protein
VKGKHTLERISRKDTRPNPNLKFDLLDLIWGLSSVVLYYVNQMAKKSEFMEVHAADRLSAPPNLILPNEPPAL